MTPLRHSAAHVFVADITAPLLDDDDQHHLARVLRLRDGEEVSASDGRGAWRICEWHDGELRTTGDVQREPAPSQRVAVAFVPVKGDRPEWTVQKLTEIGVDEIIVLVPTRRAVVRWGDDKHMQKLLKVAREASMQSRRVWLPVVTGPIPLADACSRPGAAVADPAGAPLAASSAAPSLVIIGPEGGFDDEEIPASIARVSLGGTILRAETATLVAATLLTDMRNRKEASR